MDNRPAKEWYVARWPALAWLETVVKLAALAVGAIAGIRALTGPSLAWPGGGRLAQVIVLVVLSLGLVAAIWDRVREREVVAMVFVVLNNLGHWLMVLALLSAETNAAAVAPFAALMLAGDLVKLVFLRVHRFSVRGQPMRVMMGLTLFYVAGYAILLLLAFFPGR